MPTSKSTAAATLAAVVGLLVAVAMAGFAFTASRTDEEPFDERAKVLDYRETPTTAAKVQPQGNGSCPTDVEGDRWVVVCNDNTQFSAVCIVDKQSGRPIVYLSTNPVVHSSKTPSLPVHIVLESLEEWVYTATSTAEVYKPNYPSSISLSDAINATLTPGLNEPHYMAAWTLSKVETDESGWCSFSGQVKHRGTATDDTAETDARLTVEFQVDRTANGTAATTMFFNVKDYSFSSGSNASKLALIYHVFGTDGALEWTSDEHKAVSDSSRVAISDWNAWSNGTAIPTQMLTWSHHPHLVNLLTDAWASDSDVNEVHFSSLFALSGSSLLSSSLSCVVFGLSCAVFLSL